MIFMIFQRKIYEKMLAWKMESDGRTALLVEGARRVGKSTVVEDFAKREYESHLIIDFSMASPEIRELFRDISDLDYLFLRLQLAYHAELPARKSVIIFDEVQLCPQARQAIKHLVKDRRYDYIETGSLISIRRNIKDILIPSEERKLQMFPMDYEEFCWAIGDTATPSLLRQTAKLGKPLGNAVHRKLMRQFRLYMLIGGMPQAIAAYLESKNFRAVDSVKRDILSLYMEDFRKVDPTGRASLLFEAVPAQLNGNASRYQVSSVLKNKRANSILSLLSEMQDSKTILLSYHANDPGAGLSAQRDLARFKIFLADTGLFVTLMFRDRDFTENLVYEKLLSDKMEANLGYLYENIVAQMLAANGHSLYYHTFLNEKSRHNYEIDFLLADGNKICPIEVKSSRYKSHPSLDAFSSKYSGRISNRCLIHTKDLGKDTDILLLPVYLVPFVFRGIR